MKYLVNRCTDPHWNMAFDQYVLEEFPLSAPVFYLWQNAPAVIIGLNQSAYAQVNLPYLEQKGITLARRVTGGGAVYHDLGNLNYSIAGPVQALGDAYGLVADALRQLGVPAERSGRNDILVEGRKCSGYAKRLYQDRMMIHGTLMWDVNLEDLTRALAVPGGKMEAAGVASVRSRVVNLKEYLRGLPDMESFQKALHGILAAADGEVALSPSQLEAIGRLAEQKFRTWEWNYGRSPVTAFQKTQKFPCGTVTVHYTLSHGLLSQLQFSGDFIGAKPASELAQKLLGQRIDALKEHPVSDYFDGLSAIELLSLF